MSMNESVHDTIKRAIANAYKPELFNPALANAMKRLNVSPITSLTIFVPTNTYRKLYQLGKTNDQRFTLKGRKLYWNGCRVVKNPSWPAV